MNAPSLQRPFRLALRWLLITLVGALLALMTAQIVLRYGFNASLLWAEEMCRYMLIWLAFLAAVLAFERGEIAALGFLGSALPRVPALVLAIVVGGLSLALCLLLVSYGLYYADRAGGSQIPAIGFILEDIFGAEAPAAPSRFWVYLALPVGMGLMALRLMADMLLCALAIRDGRSLAQVLDRTLTEGLQ
ncbi:TRAP transporter small permease [Pseudooceanicola aestuarii]|uniref:TRAP transporter small permease n=1 Tax=Pseudooceanicola aestuarii TaxID=2697319 RepID=UPI0013D4E818|nr:TRAP transporter small permease subunit [Pseudooceanicola aestuarii]